MIFFATCTTTFVLSVQMKGNQVGILSWHLLNSNVQGRPIPECLRVAIRRSRLLRFIFKNIETKKKHVSWGQITCVTSLLPRSKHTFQKSKDCLCMNRSRSNSFILKSETNNECRWVSVGGNFNYPRSQFAPPYTTIGSDPIYQKLLLTIGDIRSANQGKRNSGNFLKTNFFSGC